MSKQTIIFLHGNSCDSTIFSNQLNDLCFSKYNLISLDLPGHGALKEQTLSGKYSIKGYAKTIRPTIQKEIDKGAQVILVGHSLGGHVFINLAGDVEIAGLVTFGAPPMESIDDMQSAFNPLPEFSTLITGNTPLIDIENFFKKVLLTNHSMKKTLIRMYLDTNPDCREDLQTTLSTHEWNEVKKYSSLKCPYVLFNPVSDPLINQEYMIKFKSHMVNIKDSRHYPHIENTSNFNLKLLEFIESIF